MDNTNTPVQPEVLKTRVDQSAPASPTAQSSTPTKPPVPGKKPHLTYRPSHKATFISLAVVILILAINGAILGFVLKNKTKSNNLASQVTINPGVLSKLGINNSSLGSSGVTLNVGPDANFGGKVTVAGNVNIAGQLKLNSSFTASDANLTQLEAGNTSLAQLDVNGSGTFTSLSVRNGLNVTGATQLQGAVSISSLSVAGNLSVGGVFSASSFSARALTSTGTLTVVGHVITGGLTPSVGPGGGALGSNGTVSISGNDAAGVVDINIGTGAGSGTLANVAFKTQYSSAPRVIITPVGVACTFYVLNLTTSGFSVADGCNLPPGGYAINYIVEQ